MQRASHDASRTSKGLEEEMDSFEKKKLTDIKVKGHENEVDRTRTQQTSRL